MEKPFSKAFLCLLQDSEVVQRIGQNRLGFNHNYVVFTCSTVARDATQGQVLYSGGERTSERAIHDAPGARKV